MIEINNLTTISVNTEFLGKIAEKVLEGEAIKKEVGLSIAFVGPSRIRELNKRYRRKNKVTDVLSFSAFTKGYGDKSRSLEKIQTLGEIIICPQQVKKNTKSYATNFKKELTRVLIHGILSLLEYDHERNKKEAERMEKREKYYLSQLK